MHKKKIKSSLILNQTSKSLNAFFCFLWENFLVNVPVIIFTHVLYKRKLMFSFVSWSFQFSIIYHEYFLKSLTFSKIYLEMTVSSSIL